MIYDFILVNGIDICMSYNSARLIIASGEECIRADNHSLVYKGELCLSALL